LNKKSIFRIALWVVSAIALLLGALAVWLSTTLPRLDGEITVSGLTAPVEVARDENGVPRIYAANDTDAAFALGFVHAQDRMWQMEGTRRLGAGRLSEVVGEAAIEADRLMRTLGIYRLAEAQYESLSPPVRKTLDSYAAGVNAWIEGHKGVMGGALGVEFAFLLHQPEPWRPADSLVWGKIMGFWLSRNFRDEILRARLARVLDADQLRQLWPQYPQENQTDGPVTVAALPGRQRLAGLASALIMPPGQPRGASNAWAIAGTGAGAGTASGKPILANDPHLSFNAPVIWYLAAIEAPGLSLTGATMPGVPFMILGHNRRIAWGMTSTESDLSDLFIEKPDPKDPARYLLPGGSEPFRTRREVITVRGGEDVTLEVRETRHGPVISDLGGISGAAEKDTVLALSATYLLAGDRTPEAMWKLNRAGDWVSFVAALKDFHSPHQNFVYADIAGDIGFLAPGRVPIRRSGTGWVPGPGWTADADWTGFIPFQELPKTRNPAQGRVISANNRIIGPEYPYFLSHDWDPAYRALRIGELLDMAAPQTVSMSVKFQTDTLSLMARRLKPLMLGELPALEGLAGAARDLLAAWDGDMDRNRSEPLIFATWVRELGRAVYADELGDLFRSYWGYRPRFLASVLETHRAWCDDVTTKAAEDCPSRLGLALEAALKRLTGAYGDEMKKWTWGEAHFAYFPNRAFSRVPILGSLTDLAIPSPGGGYTVNRGAGHLSDATTPYANVHGAGYRAVYDLADLNRSRFMIATGQSGNPLSPAYDDLMEPWRDGKTFSLGHGREDLKDANARVLRLIPG